MSQNHKPQSPTTAPLLIPQDIQLIHAHRHIILLQATLQAVREDLELRADIGTSG